MEKVFLSVDEVLADEDFLNWYFTERVNKPGARWTSTSPEQETMVNQAITLLADLPRGEKQVPANQVDAAAAELNAAINKKTTPVVNIKTSRNRWWLSAAAVLVAIAGILLWKMTSSKETFSTQYGQLSKHVLPDGSEVMLNANSTVKLGDNWEDGDREVWLEGEAFFHVKKKTGSNRFIVHINKADVIVTGTQFNVINRDEKTSVLLTEGSVTLRTKDGREIKMHPGDFVEVETNEVQKKSVNEEAILAWKENRLYFDKTSVKDAAKMISDHYGVKVTLADDSVGMKTLNGMMPNNNLDVLLKALEATSDFKITRNENEIVISNP